MSDIVERAKEPLDAGARLDAYYYAFRPTGVGLVDRILSAVAVAGKAYHNTDQWGEARDWEEDESQESRIQKVANESALLVSELVEEIETLRAAFCPWHGRRYQDWVNRVAQLQSAGVLKVPCPKCDEVLTVRCGVDDVGGPETQAYNASHCPSVGYTASAPHLHATLWGHLVREHQPNPHPYMEEP